LIGKPPESLSDAYLDLTTRVLREMRRQGIEESVRELVQRSYRDALGNVGALPLISDAERERIGERVLSKLLVGMIAMD
jgi:hypothetical protein